MTFEWDEAKSNWTKVERGFDFDYASTVFLDSDRVEGFSRLAGTEVRLLVIGKTPADELLAVIYTRRQYGEEKVCRIISARKAHKTERSRYPGVH
jgi:uncharacterized DUF497 family protein